MKADSHDRFLSRERRRHRRLQRHVLAEWRGFAEPPDPERNLRGIAQALREWGEGYGLAQGIAEEELTRFWPELVGPFIARHSAPKSLRRGVLSVAVVQASVRYALEQEPKDEMLARLQERFGVGVIREIRFSSV